MPFLTDRTLATGVTLQDLIHIVITGDTSQGNFAGSSYKATIQQVSDIILSGQTQLYEVGSGTDSTQRSGVGSNASGPYSTVSGGLNNTSSGNHSFIGGGSGNTANNCFTFIGGGRENITIGFYSTISGGYCNTSSGGYSTVSGGLNNTTSGYWSTVGGGLQNTSNGQNSTVSGGRLNKSICLNSTISGGYCNTSICTSATVSGGLCNTSSGCYSFVGGGWCNTSSCYSSSIVGGKRNTTFSNYGTILGGSGNTVTHQYSSATGKDVISVSACTFHVNYLALQDTPTTDSSISVVLVRDSVTGVVKQRDITNALNKNYASFYDTGDQTGLANTELTMSANTSDSWNTGITLSANTIFVIQNPGVYSLAFSAQMVKTGGNSSTHAHIWLYQNGLDVPYSASQIGFPSNSVYVVPAWNFFFSTTTPNEYVELKWEINSNVNNQLLLKYQPAAGNVPEIPSLIVTINQVN